MPFYDNGISCRKYLPKYSNQMLKLEQKLMQFNKKNEANRILLRVPRSFSETENFSDGIGIIVLITGITEEVFGK